MNLLEISSYLFRDLREFPGHLTCMCGSVNLYNFASVTWVPMLNTTRGIGNPPGTIQLLRALKMLYLEWWETISNIFLHVHMLLQTRELHNRRPWALLLWLDCWVYGDRTSGITCGCTQIKDQIDGDAFKDAPWNVRIDVFCLFRCGYIANSWLIIHCRWYLGQW